MANQAATAIISYQTFPEDRTTANIPGFKERLFDFNRVQKHRLLDVPDPSRLRPDGPRRCRFAFSITTDGHMVSVIRTVRKDVRLQNRNADLRLRNKYLYPLYKNPTGITLNDYIVGVDPDANLSVRDVVCVVDCSQEQLNNKQSSSKTELQNRKKKRVQNVYDQLQKFITAAIIGKTNSNEPYRLANDSTKTSRKRKRREYRSTAKNEPGDIRSINDDRRTVVAYGDASTSGSMSGCSPTPVKFWNRDINTACNICSIVVAYVLANYNLDSRPNALRRDTRNVDSCHVVKYTTLIVKMVAEMKKERSVETLCSASSTALAGI
ncbi:hypothetical protein EDC94DRAFT_589270 [Helicostylum pulchrum]|nr:hypothetical protein EDC94DRAFT_589270 [Helicostylum pulchrum]